MIPWLKIKQAAGRVPAVCPFIHPLRQHQRSFSSLGRRILRAMVIVAAASSTGALSTGTLTGAHAADLIIGVAGPMSGPLSAAGKQYVAAVTHAATAINKSGGLNGQRLKIITADDKATPKRAIAAAQKLVAANASIVIGHYNSTPTIAANEIYLKNNILLIAPQAIISRLTDKKAWNVLRLAPRADGQALAAAHYLATALPPSGGAPKIAIAHDNSPFARLLAEKAGASLKARGINPALSGEIPPGSRHTGSVIRRLADRIATANITGVYWTGSSSDAARFLIALRARKSAAVFVGTDVLAGPGFAATEKPGALAGARMTLAAPLPKGEAVSALLQNIKIKARGEQALPALSAYAATQLIAAAAGQTKTNDPKKLARNLRSGKTIKTILGSMSFDTSGDRREKLYRIYSWTLAEDGKLIYQAETAK